jgi:hypothetical protein
MRYLLLVCFAGAALGQGTETKPKADDYEVHAQAPNAAIGAEFTVHSFSRGEQSFLAEDYLVVEVALFPPKGETIEVGNAQFALRINGRKQLLQPQPPTMVVASLEHPEWEQPGAHTEVGASAGNIGGVMGVPPRNTNPFPGSPPPAGTRPPPVEIPKDNPSGLPKEPPVKVGELLLATALVEGPHHAATSGFLYFPFRGKIGSIKTLELIYQDAVLKLR